MGIPSYFSYIIQNHTDVLCKYKQLNTAQFSRLYMDCNSILYDIWYNEINLKEDNIENEIIVQTKIKIEKYIRETKPTDIIFIAFDGVAPVSKLEQQRNRRYKSWFQNIVTNNILSKDETTKYTTSMFTPGTSFMNKLSEYMIKEFSNKENYYGVKTIIIETPNSPGEGEHKLFNHLRENPCENHETSAIYGLDADLLMLGLFHLEFSKNMYIFREAPQFAQNLLDETKIDTKPDELLFINIRKLGNSIIEEMDCKDSSFYRMNDYVFMCFFLGNDFLPHFPSLNIRTKGMTVLLETYRNILGCKSSQFLVSKEKTINWSNLLCFVRELAKNELEYIHQEYKLRNRWENKPSMLHPHKTEDEKIKLFQNTPMLYRKEEKYINPYNSNWEERYYKILFHKEIKKQNVCKNYLEGLEWVFNYYLLGKVNWYWKYKYSYPPLLKDLSFYLSKSIYNMKDILSSDFEINNKPIASELQLCYVLPPTHHFLIPEHAKKKEYYKELFYNFNYKDNLPIIDFQWAFCRYLWESHIKLPYVSSEKLVEWNENQ